MVFNDSEIYSEVKSELQNEFGQVYNCSDEVFIIAIARKGPRQLEEIFRESIEKNKEKCRLNVLTELAIPYFFNSLKDSPTKPSLIYLYDDAVYYGTTMESVYNELKEYMVSYGLDIKIKPYTGVLTAEAKEDLNFTIKSVVSKVRKGYGHYFIRRLTKDIRSLRLPFELEFPIIYYKVDGADFYDPYYRQLLLKALENQYGDNKVYDVDYYKEKEYSITILLNSNDDLTSINKIRIYPSEDGNISVTCISPYILQNSADDFQDAYRGTPYQDIWKTVLEHSIPAFDFISEDIARNRRKSLVSFYSYLNSYRIFLNRKTGLIKALCEVFGSSNVKIIGFKEKDIFYLFGDRVLSSEICNKLRGIYSSNDETKLTIRKVQLYPSFPVFEIPNFPTLEERQRLEFKNMETIKKCSSVQQALSVLFFNQSCLVEKWSRHHTRYDQKRLRFGQTFESIFQNVKLIKGLGDNLFTIKTINKWVDRRIDQGCVVPQYVNSHNDGRWYRVFRPGENEDAVLSCLCRISLLVLSEINKILGRSEIEIFALEYLLSIPFMRGIDINVFSDAIGISLKIVGDRLLFKDDDSDEFTPLIDYLLKTGVIEKNEKNENNVLASKSLVDDELAEVTTLDESIERNFRNYIDTILRDLADVDSRLYYTVFNFYAFTPHEPTLVRYETNIGIFAQHCDDTLFDIEKSQNNNVHISSMDIFNSLISDYTTIRSLQMNEKYWLNHTERLSELSPDIRIQERVRVIQQKLLQLRGIYEIIIYSYVYIDYSSLMLRFKLYLDSNDKRGKLFENLREIRNSLSDENHFNSNVWDRHTVLSYRSFLNNVIKYTSL